MKRELKEVGHRAREIIWRKKPLRPREQQVQVKEYLSDLSGDNRSSVEKQYPDCVDCL